jgi:hypothetical protein
VPCFAGEIFVPANHQTIQAAIDAAVNGDEIIVSPGVYAENIQFGGKNIVLRSTDPTDPDVVADTIIDGNRADSVVTLAGTEGEACALAGFTIRNGSARTGGGVYGKFAHLAIRNNIFLDSYAGQGGGGVFECNGVIENNTFFRNATSWYGGAICRCDGVIQNNLIYGNTGDYGGGLAFCEGVIQNNTVWGNANFGIYSCNGPVVNCVVWGNNASTGDQVYGGSTPSYSCIQDWLGGEDGNIALDPRFVDPINGDFHLLPDSPCIDRGGTVSTLAEDFEGDPRPCDISSVSGGDGSGFDIGADEYIPFGDIDKNGHVDAVDVQLVINAALGLTVPCDCDVNKDGPVDAVDVQLVINCALGLF